MTDRLGAFAAAFRQGGRPPGHELPTVAPGTPIRDLRAAAEPSDANLREVLGALEAAPR